MAIIGGKFSQYSFDKIIAIYFFKTYVYKSYLMLPEYIFCII